MNGKSGWTRVWNETGTGSDGEKLGWGADREKKKTLSLQEVDEVEVGYLG